MRSDIYLTCNQYKPGPFRRFSPYVWQNTHVNNVMHGMVCDVYFWILHIYIIFIKMLGPVVLYLTYELVQIFISFKRNDASLFKQVNKQYGEKILPKDFTYTA